MSDNEHLFADNGWESLDDRKVHYEQDGDGVQEEGKDPYDQEGVDGRGHDPPKDNYEPSDSDPLSLDNSIIDIGIIINIPVPAEAAGMMLGQKRETLNAIRDGTGCIHMDMEADTGADH